MHQSLEKLIVTQFIQNLKVHHGVSNRPPLNINLSQSNPAHTLILFTK
jgi:hypothetical protein